MGSNRCGKRRESARRRGGRGREKEEYWDEGVGDLGQKDSWRVSGVRYAMFGG